MYTKITPHMHAEICNGLGYMHKRVGKNMCELYTYICVTTE